MLPGKKYDIDELARIAWDRKWLILLPTLLVGVATFVYSQYLPNRYQSEARVLIVPQQVPEEFVQPTVTARLDERLNSIRQQILSRTRLEALIQEFNLYAEQRKTMIMQDVVDQMSRDIAVEIPRTRSRNEQPGYFVVRFESSDARTAMRVTERIAALFINENLQDREVLAQQTSQFLQTQLEEARRKLLDHEAKLEAYRRANAGQLPTQTQSNLQVLQTTQQQLQAAVEAANRDHDRQLALDQLIADAESQLEQAAVAATASGGTVAATGTAAQQLEAARTVLRNLELRLRPEHPDVSRARRQIQELEQKVAAEALEPTFAAAPAAADPATAAQRRRLAEMRVERDAITRRVAANIAEQSRLQGVIAAYRARIEGTPARETELIELTRDYDTLQESYKSLLVKSQASDLAVNLERRQIGQQFRLIDAARLPERPVSPNRARINALGALGGLAFALGIVALLEYRDTTLKSDDDVMTSLALPVLAVIPIMRTLSERRTAARRRLLMWGAATGAAVIGVALAAWRFDVLQAWVR